MAVLSKRGRFMVAEPVFERGRQLTLDGAARRAAAAGDLVLLGWGKRGARVVRSLGRPDVARDVLEALMIDRGLRRTFPRAVEAEAESVCAGAHGRRPAAPRSHGSPDLHHRPGHRARLRRRDLGAARGRRHDARVGAHRRRERVRAPRHAARARDLPARHQRLRARRGGADAAARAVERRLQPGGGPGAAGRDGRAGHARRRGALGRVPPLAHSKRRAPDLRPGGPGVRRRGARRGPVGRAARGRARGGRRAARASRPARVPGDRVGRAGVRVRRSRPRGRRPPRGADRVAPDDRGADDPGQRAGRRLPGRPPGAHALPGARAPAAAGGRAADRPAGQPRRAHASGAAANEPAAGRRDRGRRKSPRGRLHPHNRPRAVRVRVADPALAAAGLLLAAQPRPRRPGQPALLPLHLADPPLPGSRGAPRAVGGARDRRRRHRAPTSCPGPPSTAPRPSARR